MTVSRWLINGVGHHPWTPEKVLVRELLILKCTRISCLEKILLIFSDTPGTYGTTMLIRLLFLSFPGFQLCFVGVFTDFIKVK